MVKEVEHGYDVVPAAGSLQTECILARISEILFESTRPLLHMSILVNTIYLVLVLFCLQKFGGQTEIYQEQFVLVCEVTVGVVVSDADVVGFQVIVNVAQTMKFSEEVCQLNADLHHAL